MKTDNLKDAFSHILWIGGATDAGKTTVAKGLAEKYDLQLYHFDPQEMSHLQRLMDAGESWPRKLLARTPDEQWVQQDPWVMAPKTISGWGQRVDLAIEDILTMPTSPLILAEGVGFFPERIHPVLSSLQQAIWLVPSMDFKWASTRRRGKPSVRNQTSDPERATYNIVTRDMLITHHVREQAAARNLALYEVDGSRTAEEMIQIIGCHFEPFLNRSNTK